MVRDEEIKRLIFYAKGLGVKVTIYNRTNKEAKAEWTLDGTNIFIYAGSSTSKTDVVLSLIHELGHHAWFIHEKNRIPDLKFEEALSREDAVVEIKGTGTTPKHLRKKILDVESASIYWWDIIIKDTNVTIPTWRVEFQKEFDVWVYKYYYVTGYFPSKKLCNKKASKLKKKWRPT